ncbi:hypothetical protein XENTR_v10015873 [Xenopus tropicalis]|nr:hypothetical protein XENTR_v10015873 [Xenopus tropicalis]
MAIEGWKLEFFLYILYFQFYMQTVHIKAGRNWSLIEDQQVVCFQQHNDRFLQLWKDLYMLVVNAKNAKSPGLWDASWSVNCVKSSKHQTQSEFKKIIKKMYTFPSKSFSCYWFLTTEYK